MSRNERAEILGTLQGIAIVLRARRETMMAEGVERAEAEAKDAEIARLREAGNVLRDKLLGFVGAMAMYADCGPDVEAIKAWEAI